MTAFAQLNNIHLEDSLRDYLSVLLRDANELSHVLHATNWLEDLTSNRNKRLATVGKLLLVLHEVWGALISVTSLLAVARLWQLHEIRHLVQVHLENRAVDQTGTASASLLRPLNKILSSFQGQVDVAVTAQQLRFFPVLVKVTWAKH